MDWSGDWAQEIARAYRQTVSNYPITEEEQTIAQRNRLFDEFFGETDWQESGQLYTPIDFSSLTETQRDKYDELLQYNCSGVKLSDTIYHITTWSRFCDALRLGGFVLVRPKDWSVSWEDTAFKNLLDRHKQCGSTSRSAPDVPDFVKCYQNSTYGMCWSLDPWNKSVVEKATRHNDYDPPILLKSTVKLLLSAYYQNRSSFARCFISKVSYKAKKSLKKIVPDIRDLQNGDIGTACHLDSTSITNEKYGVQNEVRILFVDVPADYSKTTIVQHDVFKNQVRGLLVKPIDLKSIITEVDAISFDIKQSIRNCGFKTRPSMFSFARLAHFILPRLGIRISTS